MAIQILIVDDFEHWRNSVRSILKGNPWFRVAGEASDGVEAVAKAAMLHPDIVLLDIGMPRLNGIEAAKRITKACPKSKIIFLTQEDSSDIQSVALDTGAVAYLLKSTAASKLLPAIERAILLDEPQALQPKCGTRELVVLPSEC